MSHLSVLNYVGILLVLMAEMTSQAKSRTAVQRRTLWACATDVVVLCSHVDPGDGRMEACIRSKKSFLTSMCANMRTSSDRLPGICKRDAGIHCEGDKNDAMQLMCLRKHRNRLSAECWQGLSRLQSDGWEPLHSRFKLMGLDTPCAKTLIMACKDVAPGYGALRWCVENNWKKLEGQCGLTKREVPENVPEVCETDALVLCKNVIKGDDRVTSCLKRLEYSSMLSLDCASAIRLQAVGLDTVCARDVTKYCAKDERTWEALVDCLHNHQEELAKGCTTRKHKFRREQLGASFLNLDTGDHTNNCAADIRKFCSGLKPGHGLIHKCLVENSAELSDGCRVPKGQVVPRGLSPFDVDSRRQASPSQPDYVQSGVEIVRPSVLSVMLDIELGAFEKNDLDGNGILDMTELHRALEKSYEHSDSKEGTGSPDRKEPRPGVSDVIKNADRDSNGGLDIDEFHSLFKHPAGGSVDSADDDPEGTQRDFDERKEGLLSRFLSNPWISMPILAIVGFFVFSYRSTVRRTEKLRRRPAPGTSLQGSSRGISPARRRR